MIRYKSIQVTIPPASEKTEAILHTTEGKKVNIKAFGRNEVDKVNSLLYIDGDLVIDIPSTLKMTNSNFIPVNMLLEGNHEVRVGGRNKDYYPAAIDLCIAYEEMKE